MFDRCRACCRQTSGGICWLRSEASMSITVKAVYRAGRMELLEQTGISEGTEVLVTIPSDDTEFWLQASQSSLAPVWDNEEDDVYEQLLER